MVLPTLRPTVLISGKVLALFAIGLLQIIVFASPDAFGYLFFGSMHTQVLLSS